MLSYKEIQDLIVNEFGADAVEEAKLENVLQPSITIRADKIADVCKFLRDNPKTYFDYLSCLSGVDYNKEDKIGVAYHLASIPNNGFQLTLHAKVKRTTEDGSLPKIPTVTNVWRTAEWHEREAYDLIGIEFTGHPDLRRILCPDDWEGHPLRKDYKVQEYYHNIKVPY